VTLLGRWRDRVVPQGAGPVLLAGVLLALAHPPFHLLVPSFVALVPFIVWHERLPSTPEGRRQARVGGFFLGLVYYTLVFYWLLVALVYYTSLAILAFLAPVIIMSWFLAAMSGAVHAVRRRAGWPIWLAFPVWWTANEWFRSNLPQVGFPWMQLGDTLSGFPWLVGAADLVGTRGLSFWLVAVNALIAMLWLARRGGPRRLAGLAAALAATLAFPIGYSLVRWNTLDLYPVARVGVVQPNVPEHLKIGDQAAAAAAAMQSADSLTAAWRASPGSLDLVILPEATFPVLLDPMPSRRVGAWVQVERWADGFATTLGSDLLYGALGATDSGRGDDQYYNSAFFARPVTGRYGRYDKRFLVPMVERVPFVDPDWFAEMKYFGGFGVGAWAAPFPLATPSGDTSFGVMICYESIFSPLARHYRKTGADFLVNITNDAWFGRDAWWSRSSALWQHPAHLVMRSIETRMGAARSGNTGVSELVDPLGRVSHATALFVPAAFTGEVLTTDGTTVYVRFGDVVGWASVLASIAGIGLVILRGRRRPRPDA